MKYLNTLQNNAGKNVDVDGHTHTKAEAGLGNVDNTTDANKPVSTATQTALDTKAPLRGGDGSFRVGNKIYNVTNCVLKGTPTEILINTGIVWASSVYMPVVHLEGYAYGQQSPMELKVGFYIFSNAIGYCGVVSMGAWRPTVKLYSYLDGNSVKKVGIALIGGIYYPQFTVHVQNEWGGKYPDGWSIANNMANNTVYSMPSTDNVTVPYKSTLDALRLQFNGVTANTYDGASPQTINITPTAIGLGNVNNTSDASKPVSTAQQTALNAKLDKTGGTLTGNLNVGTGASNTSKVTINISNAGSPQIDMSDTDGDNYWSVGCDDNDNNFSIHGSTSANPVINNISNPHFEITTTGVLKASGNTIYHSGNTVIPKTTLSSTAPVTKHAGDTWYEII